LIGPDARSPFTAGVCVTAGVGEEEDEIFTVVVVETSSFRAQLDRDDVFSRHESRFAPLRRNCVHEFFRSTREGRKHTNTWSVSKPER